MTWSEYRLKLARLLVLEHSVPGAVDTLREVDGFYEDAQASGQAEGDFLAWLGAPEGFVPEGAPALRPWVRFAVAALVLAVVGVFLSSYRFQIGQLRPMTAWAAPVLLPVLLWFVLRLRQRSLVALFAPRAGDAWMYWGMAGGLLLMLGLYPFTYYWISVQEPALLHTYITVHGCYSALLRLAMAAGLASALYGLWRCRIRCFPALAFWPGILSTFYFLELPLRSMDLDPLGSGPLWLLFVPSPVCLVWTLVLTLLAFCAVKRAERRAGETWTHS